MSPPGWLVKRDRFITRRRVAPDHQVIKSYLYNTKRVPRDCCHVRLSARIPVTQESLLTVSSNLDDLSIKLFTISSPVNDNQISLFTDLSSIHDKTNTRWRTQLLQSELLDKLRCCSLPGQCHSIINT